MVLMLGMQVKLNLQSVPNQFSSSLSQIIPCHPQLYVYNKL